MNTEQRLQGRDGRGPFLPMLLIGVAAAIAMATQVWLQWNERRALSERVESQAPALADGHRLRSNADALFSKLQVLSDKANPDAQFVVRQLQQRGLTIHPGAKTPEPPAG